MDNKIWGSHFWNLLHGIGTLYPNNPTVKDIEMYTKLINSYLHLLPCPVCKNHLSQNLGKLNINHPFEKNVPYYKSKNGIILWGIKFHNVVNKSIGKPINISEDTYGITYIKNKYNFNQILPTLKTVLRYALDGIKDFNSSIDNSFTNLFFSTAHFLLYQNVDIVLMLKKKNISVDMSFNNKTNIQKVINSL